MLSVSKLKIAKVSKPAMEDGMVDVTFTEMLIANGMQRHLPLITGHLPKPIK